MNPAAQFGPVSGSSSLFDSIPRRKDYKPRTPEEKAKLFISNKDVRARRKAIMYPGGKRSVTNKFYRGARTDPRVKISLWEDYISGRMTLNEIAIKHKMSAVALDQLVLRERWPARRRALEKELFDTWHLKIQQLQHRSIAKVMSRQLEHAELLGVELMKQLKSGKLTAKDFQNVAQAFKSYEDVAARAAGLDRMPALDREQTVQPQGKITWNLQVQDEGAPAQDAEFTDQQAKPALPAACPAIGSPVDPLLAPLECPRNDPEPPIHTQMAPPASERLVDPPEALGVVPGQSDQPDQPEAVDLTDVIAGLSL